VERCAAHSGLEEKLIAIDEKLDDHKNHLIRIESRLLERSERLSAIDSEMNGVKNMVIGAFAFITLVAGWLYYHITK